MAIYCTLACTLSLFCKINIHRIFEETKQIGESSTHTFAEFHMRRQTDGSPYRRKRCTDTGELDHLHSTNQSDISKI